MRRSATLRSTPVKASTPSILTCMDDGAQGRPQTCTREAWPFRKSRPLPVQRVEVTDWVYWFRLLPTCENTLFAFDPMSRIVPTTRTRITASMTAYSAISCPSSSVQNLRSRAPIFPPPSCCVVLKTRTQSYQDFPGTKRIMHEVGGLYAKNRIAKHTECQAQKRLPARELNR